jgi:inner membrane transporter RhtA
MGLAAVTGVAWAAFVPLSKWAGRVLPGHDGLTVGLWVASLLLLPFALAEGSVGHAGGIELAGALVIALLNVVLPMVLEFRALQRMSARTYGVLTTLEPAIGALLGTVLLGQEIGFRTAAAVACVTLAALGITLSDRDSAR